VTRRDWPFDWVELDGAGQPARRSVAAAADTALAGWHSYAVLPIENGYIQTVENAAHSRRRYRLFDILGRLVGYPTGAASPVLVAVIPGSRLLLGFRYLNPTGSRSVPWVYGY
jgi:hypothetical protein